MHCDVIPSRQWLTKIPQKNNTKKKLELTKIQRKHEIKFMNCFIVYIYLTATKKIKVQ